MCVCMQACVRLCACVCVGGREGGIVTLLGVSPPFVLPEADQARGK